MKKSSQYSPGFTLLEVIIAISILAFISVFTANSIQTALKAKRKIELEIDNSSLIRDALRVMGGDIRRAFKYQDIRVSLFNLAQKERKKRYESKGKTKTDPNKKDPDNPNSTKPAGTTPPKTGVTEQKPPKEFPLKKEVIVTRFLGQEDNLHFSSLSNRRTYTDAQISNQAEIGYYLEDCKNRLNKKKESKCLWRRLSHIIDSEIEEGGKAIVLVENVTEFSLRYLALNPEDDPKWLDSWDSNEQDNKDTGNKFPQAVEITLELHDKQNKKDKPIKMTYVAPLRFPTGIILPTEEAIAEEKSIGKDTEGVSGEKTTE